MHTALDLLITAFRAQAHALVAAMPDIEVTDEVPEEVEVGGDVWWVHWHDPHYRFENDAGVVVEAHIYDPDDLDPAFLLEYARTAGHDAFAEVTFRDMCHLLDRRG